MTRDHEIEWTKSKFPKRIQHVIRGVLWDLTKPIGRRQLPRDLICIRFEDLTISNQNSYSNFLFEKPITCFVLIIWQSFLFDVLEIWQIRTDFGSNLSNLQNVEQKIHHVSQPGLWVFCQQFTDRGELILFTLFPFSR